MLSIQEKFPLFVPQSTRAVKLEGSQGAEKEGQRTLYMQYWFLGYDHFYYSAAVAIENTFYLCLCQ